MKRSTVLFFPILSFVVITLAAILCILLAPEWNPLDYTISMIVIFPNTELIFNLSWVIKAILDVLWALAVFRILKIKAFSPKGIFLLFPLVSFALIGIISVNVNEVLHTAVVLSVVFTWAFGQIIYTRALKDSFLNKFTVFMIIFQMASAVATLTIWGWHSVFPEAVYIYSCLVWVIVFIWRLRKKHKSGKLI